MAAWTGWETDILNAGKWPVTSENILFLSTWHHPYEDSVCTFNPINTTLKRGTSTNCVHVSGTTYVQNYKSKQLGTTATVATLNNGFYPDIVGALKTGDPFNYPASSAVAAEITRWGTPNFAAWYLAHLSGTVVPPPPPPTPGSPDAVAPQAHRGYADLRNSVNNHLPKQLERSHRTGLATLRAIGRKSKVGR